MGATSEVIKCFDEKKWAFYALKIYRLEYKSLLKIIKEIETLVKFT
jgi:hypothetical protein